MRAELIGTFCFLFSNRWHLVPLSMEKKIQRYCRRCSLIAGVFAAPASKHSGDVKCCQVYVTVYRDTFTTTKTVLQTQTKQIALVATPSPSLPPAIFPGCFISMPSKSNAGKVSNSKVSALALPQSSSTEIQGTNIKRDDGTNWSEW